MRIPLCGVGRSGSRAAALAPGRPAPLHEAQLPRANTALPSPQLGNEGEKRNLTAMKDDEIEAIIDSVNSGSSVDRVFSYRLMDNVSFARVWSDLPRGKPINVDGYNFYLLHAETGECIGAVLDMVTDLHAFIKEPFRRNGITSTALRNIILPHIFSRGRTDQDVTFRSGEARGLVLKLGFEITEENRARITANAVRKVDFPSIEYTGIDEERIAFLRKRLDIAVSLIRMVRDELGIRLGDYLSERLSNIAWEVKWKSTDVLDYWRREEMERFLMVRTKSASSSTS